MELKSEQLWSLVQPRLRTYVSQTWDVGLVAEVTGSTHETVTQWLTVQVPPGGRIIKLWHLLAALGYESPELATLPYFNRLCGEIYTFAGADLGEIAEIIGARDNQAALRTLRGITPMHPAYTTEDLSHLYGEKLTSGKKKIKPLDLTKNQVEVPVQTTSPTSSFVELLAENSNNVLIAAMLFNAALPMARYLDDDATAEDRTKLRSLMGEEGMFVLSNHFYNLCGERARSNRK